MFYKYLSFAIFFSISWIFQVSAQPDELYFGPFKSWTNLKTTYGAYGDGIHDDTHALQTALDELGKNNHSPILYIPNGTYRITATLAMQSRRGIGIIGENPEQTIIKWDGPVAMKMFFLNGVTYSEFSRITWDGNNKAMVAVAHEWDGKIPSAVSGMRHTDEIFKNVGVGLKSGKKMDAEFAIRRCRFYNCSITGISLQGFNALDWWVWDSYFENCKKGIANNVPEFGAGNFHVYRSIFKNSSDADISLGNSNYFSFRDNISYHSNCFIAASQFSNGSQITLQGNIIISNSMNPMAKLFTKGNVLILDNTFISPDSAKSTPIDITNNFRTPAPDIVLIGNRFTSKKNYFINPGGRSTTIDNETGISPNIVLPSIKPVAFAEAATYNIIEINSTMNSEAIQATIDNAVTLKQKSIIHFAYGDYKLSKTINLHSNREINITGDGLSSILSWTGDSSHAMIEINSGSNVLIQNLYLNGKNKSDGIVIHDNDKAGNYVYGDQLLLFHGGQTNLTIDKFSNTDFRFENFQHNYCDKGTSVTVVGSGTENNSLVKIFGGESSNGGNSYSISKNGRLLIYDTWYENGRNSNFLQLEESGEFTLNGGKIANTYQNTLPESYININGFKGKVTLAEIILNEKNKTISVNDGNNQTHFLALGLYNWSDTTNIFFHIHCNSDNYATIHNRYNIGQGAYPLENTGNSGNIFLKEMLASIRQNRVSDKPMKPGKLNSQVCLQRVMIENGVNNVKIVKD